MRIDQLFGWMTVPVAAITLTTGCKEPVEESVETPPPVVVETPVPATPAPATPAPATPPPPISEVATPPPNYFAPEGVFYLVRAVSVESDSGLVGLKPGTKVVRQPDGSFRTDEHTLKLAPDQITNDLRVLQQVSGADAAAQAALRRQATSSAPAPKTTTPKPTKGDVNARLKEIASERAVAHAEQDKLVVQINRLGQQLNAAKTSPNAANWEKERAGLQSQLATVKEKLRVLNTEQQALYSEARELGR